MVAPSEIRFLIQNQKVIQGLLGSLKGELVRFLESGINEDDVLESALIGNRSIYEPGHEGSYSPDPGGKMTSIIQKGSRDIADNIQAQVAREILQDVDIVGYSLEKLAIAANCLTSRQKPIFDLMADGLSAAEIADRLVITPEKYKRQEAEILDTLAIVACITRKDFQRIVELLKN